MGRKSDKELLKNMRKMDRMHKTYADMADEMGCSRKKVRNVLGMYNRIRNEYGAPAFREAGCDHRKNKQRRETKRALDKKYRKETRCVPHAY